MRSLPWRLVSAITFWWVAVLLAGVASAVRVSDVRLTVPEVQEDVDLPYEWPDGAPNFEFSARVAFPLGSARPFITLQADDCIRTIQIDGRTIFASNECKACDNCSFRRFPVPPDLAHGDRTLYVRGTDLGPPARFDVREARNLPLWAFLLFGAFGSVVIVVARRRGFPVSMATLGLAGGLLGVLYFEATPAVIRSHDFSEHFEYLKRLASHSSLPPPGGWESHQPPLYYAVGAFFKQAMFGKWFVERTAYQAFSLLCFFFAVGVGVRNWQRIHRALADHAWASWAGISCFVFMPAHVFLSARVSNDAILPLLGTITIGLCWRYSERPSRWGAIALGVASALALGSKLLAGGAVAAALASVAWEARERRTPLREALIRLACVGLPAALVIAVWTGRNHYLLGSFIAAPDPADELLHPNTAGKFLSFLYDPYLSAESLDPYAGEIRNSLPTALLVSTLSGEFRFPQFSLFALTLERFFFLGPVGAAVFGSVRGFRVSPALWLPCAVASVVSCALLALSQFLHPYTCIQDARFLSTAFFPIAALVAIGARSIDDRSPSLARYLLRPSFVAFGVLLGLFWLNLR